MTAVLNNTLLQVTTFVITSRAICFFEATCQRVLGRAQMSKEGKSGRTLKASLQQNTEWAWIMVSRSKVNKIGGFFFESETMGVIIFLFERTKQANLHEEQI